MKEILLSIVIPVYNVEKYIYKCIWSIIEQNSDMIEIIVIDDCGTDGSMKIVQSIIDDYSISNIKIIIQPENKGLSEARNAGIKVAIGEYIAFVDSDDWVEKNSIASILEYISQHKVDIFEIGLREINETGIDYCLENTYLVQETPVMSGDEYFSFLCEQNAYSPVSVTRIYKTKYLKSNELFYPNIISEDEEFSPRLIIFAETVQKVNIPFYVYRRREGSISTSFGKNDKWVSSYIIIIKSFECLERRIAGYKSELYIKRRKEQMVLSLYKNCIAYNTPKCIYREVIRLVKKKKMYKIPMKSSKLSIKIQGVFMIFPRVFSLIYQAIKKKER